MSNTIDWKENCKRVQYHLQHMALEKNELQEQLNRIRVERGELLDGLDRCEDDLRRSRHTTDVWKNRAETSEQQHQRAAAERDEALSTVNRLMALIGNAEDEQEAEMEHALKQRDEARALVDLAISLFIASDMPHSVVEDLQRRRNW